MITVNEAFRIFRTRLETTDTEDATASRRQRRLREQLDATLDIEEDFLTGSYVRHTKTKPLRDVDIMIVLTDTSYLKRHPHEILEAIRAVLAVHYGDHRVCIDRRAVRVDFGAEYVDNVDGEIITFDVVPAFKDGQDYLIPDEVLGTWVPTNPRTHADLATAANKAFDGQWKPLVKMIKRWNKTAGSPIEPSFLLEVMGLDLLVSPWSGQHAYEIRQFFASAADRIADRWPDPAHLGPDVSDVLDADTVKMARARAALRAAEATATKAIQADRQGRPGEALRIWRSLFGEAFPTS
jgi:Second Messenger Oligonucleotide or Dinucleotide Synthetase domain